MGLKEIIFMEKSSRIDSYGSRAYEGSVQEWLPIKNIINGVVVTKDNRFIKIIETMPVNFNLKPPTEQQTMIYYFASYLKIAPQTLQVRVLTQRMDLDGYVRKMHDYHNTEENDCCRGMIEDNIAEVSYIAANEVTMHRFFIAFEYEPQMKARNNSVKAITTRLNEEADVARRYLDLCGLEVLNPEYADNAVLELMYEMINKRKSKHIRLPDGVFDMVSPIHGVYGSEQLNSIDALPDESCDSGADDSGDAKSKRKKIKLFNKAKGLEDEFVLEEGSTTIQDIIAPTSVDLTKRDYIEIDGTYYAYLYITGYGYTTVVGNGWLSALVEAGEGVGLNFIIKKQPKDKILSKISQTTMVNRSRMRDVGDTREDFEELDSAITAGLYLKENMNRNNEDFYYMNTVIEVTADNPDVLEQRLSAVETLCVSMDMLAKRCDYRHEQGFLTCLPLVSIDSEIERKAKRNALTTGVAAAFPFASYELCDKTGIFIGKNLHNNSACMLDLFDRMKYANGNICWFGSTGAGKTYGIQTIAGRLRQQGKRIYIIAPSKGYEYRSYCQTIGGEYIKWSPSSSDSYNPMEIRRKSLDADLEARGIERNDSLLANHIPKLTASYALLKKNLTDEDKNYLDKSLVECYRRFGITFENETLFSDDGSYKSVPTFADWYALLNESEETKHLAIPLLRFVEGSAAAMVRESNINRNAKYYVFDVSDSPEELREFITFWGTQFCMDMAQESILTQDVIITDESWILVGATSTPQIAGMVLEMAKTIRGYNGILICASQGLKDFLSLDDGRYGEGIIDSCRIKIIMQLEENEAMRVKKILNLSDSEAMQITRNRRGEALLSIGNSRINLAIHSSRKEYEAITTAASDILARRSSQ